MSQDLTYLSAPADLYPWVPWLALGCAVVMVAGIAAGLVTCNAEWAAGATLLVVTACFTGICLMMAGVAP